MNQTEIIQEEVPWASIKFLSNNENYPGQSDNFVRTTRYTFWTFIPLTLFENFRNLSNIYFLIILILSALPFSPVSWIYNFFPLLFVLIVSMIRAGIEDGMKRSEDKKRNSAPIKIYRSGKWNIFQSSEIHVGDLVQIEGDAQVPCDMLYITSSNPNKSTNYSETQLNGESAVKTISSFSLFKEEEFPSFFENNVFEAHVPQPSRDLTRFDATLVSSSSMYSLSIANILLRGMSIHYTDYVIGVALATGHDSKIMKNQRHPPAKVTTFDKAINNMILSIFILNLCLVTLSSGICTLFEHNGSFPLIEGTLTSKGNSFLIAFMQYFVIYSYMIPISLMVTVEISRLYALFSMGWDNNMTDEEYGRQNPHCSYTIAQLGQVTHVLSDKTGTLTENVMILSSFLTSQGQYSAQDFINNHLSTLTDPLSIEQISSNSIDEIQEISSNVSQNDMPTRTSQNFDFLMAMALCNTVIVHKKANDEIEYNAESPDEAAFVKFAAQCGIKLIAREPDTISIDILGQVRTYKIISILPFDSDRKRMSIVLQQEGIEDSAIVYTKGADVIIFQRSRETMFQEEIRNYAIQGLRTLVFASKELRGPNFEKWKNDYHRASTALSGRDEAIAAIAPYIESDLNVLGVSAVEDRLQKDVPQTISWLLKAGISFWVLTGDKLETAIEIGKTSNVITPSSDILIISVRTEEEVSSELRQYIENFDSFTSPVLVVTEKAVEYSMNECIDLFLPLALKCRSVILSRVSPFMKASVVAAVKKYPGTVTLAIGDGANDVGMIQEAHVGIGINGREGSQAAQSSDFAIPRFRFLIRMIAVHGHWVNNRLTHLAVIMLYKNFTFIFALLWSEIDTLMSPTDFYNDFFMSCFNLIFTLFPPFAYSLFERDVAEEYLMKYPMLHNSTNDPMKFPFIIYYFCVSLYQSVVIYYSVRLSSPYESIYANGNMTFLIVVLVTTLQMSLWIKDWNIFTFISLGLSYVLVFSIFSIYGFSISPELYSAMKHNFGTLSGWGIIILSIFLSITPPLIIEYFMELIHPSNIRLINEKVYFDRSNNRRKRVENNNLELSDLSTKSPK